MLCKKCGRNIEDTSKFCGYCGEKVEAINNSQLLDEVINNIQDQEDNENMSFTEINLANTIESDNIQTMEKNTLEEPSIVPIINEPVANNTVVEPSINPEINNQEVNEYEENANFYRNRYETHPLYNKKLKMFKFHSDDSNINDNDFTRFFKIVKIENFPPSLRIFAILKEVPKHMQAFPVSKRLVVIMPTGPRKLWTNGIVKFPMLYPLIFNMAKA